MPIECEKGTICTGLQVDSTPSEQRGLTLLEVLIALLVLSIGMVGMAALYVNSLQNVHSSLYRSLGSTIALDFEERLWLALGDDSVTDCPNSGTVAAALQTHWRAPTSNAWAFNGEELLRPSAVTVQLGTTVTTDGFATIPIVVGWSENRFDDEGTFEHVARVLCRQSDEE
jgi:type IV pilus assembly protein PilV